MKSGNIASPTTDEVQVNAIEKDRQRLQGEKQKKISVENAEAGTHGNNHGYWCWMWAKKLLCKSMQLKPHKRQVSPGEQNSSDEDDGTKSGQDEQRVTSK